MKWQLTDVAKSYYFERSVRERVYSRRYFQINLRFSESFPITMIIYMYLKEFFMPSIFQGMVIFIKVEEDFFQITYRQVFLE